MEKFINSLPIELETIISSLIVILVAILIYQIFRWPIKRLLGVNKNKKGNTVLSMVSSFIRLAYIAIVVLIVLQINGIDVSNIIAASALFLMIITKSAKPSRLATPLAKFSLSAFAPLSSKIKAPATLSRLLTATSNAPKLSVLSSASISRFHMNLSLKKLRKSCAKSPKKPLKTRISTS